MNRKLKSKLWSIFIGPDNVWLIWLAGLLGIGSIVWINILAYLRGYYG